MAEVRISDLNATTTLNETDVFEVDTGAASNKVALSVIRTALAAQQIVGIAGTAAAPSFAVGDAANGLYRVGANDVGIATNGVLRLDVSTTLVTSTLPYIAPVGAVGAPAFAFTGDATTGVYRVGASSLGIAAGGVLVGAFAVQTSGAGATLAITDSTRTGGAGALQLGVTIAHTLNQTSTAAFTSLDISQTVTAAGSGAQYLINAKAGAAGTTQVFAVTSAGFAFAAAGGATTPSVAFVGATTTGLYSVGAGFTGFSSAGADCAAIGNSSSNAFFQGRVGETTLTTAINNSAVTLRASSSLGAGAAIKLTNGSTATHSSGTPPFIAATQTYNQTSTAGYSLIQGIATETGTGSGAKLLLDLQAGSSPAQVFIVTNKGGYSVAVASPAALANGNVDDYAGMAGYSFARLTPDTVATTLRGILAPVVSTLGRKLTIINLGNGAGTLTVNNQDAGSAAANRIQTKTGAATAIATNGVMNLIYDPTSAFWREV